MKKEFTHPENTPFSHTLIKRIQKILGVSGLAMSRALGITHDQSWDYLQRGAKIQPYIVERLITFLSTEQLIILRGDLIKEHRDQIEKNRFPNLERPTE